MAVFPKTDLYSTYARPLGTCNHETDGATPHPAKHQPPEAAVVILLDRKFHKHEDCHPENDGERDNEAGSISESRRTIGRWRRLCREDCSSCGSNEVLPNGDRCGRDRIGALRLRRPIEDLVPASQKFSRQRRVLPAHHRPIFEYRPIPAVAQHELPQEHQRLGWPQLRHRMARALEQHIRQIPLLMHDPRERAIVVEPWRRRPPREALYASKREVLDDDLRAAVRDVRVVITRVEDERDPPRGRVREERREERDGLDGRVPVLVSDRNVIGGPERVRDMDGPVFGHRSVEGGAHNRIVEEGPSVFWGRGVHRVGDVVEVDAAIFWCERRQ